MTSFNIFWQRAGVVAGATASLALLSGLLGQTAKAATISLDFEGLQNLEPISNFYNGGTGGFGSTGGRNFGIQFSENSLAIVDEDAGGTGNFGGEPSPDTIAFFLTGDSAVMDVASGFDTGFSFFYSAVNRPGVVNVYDELGGTGNLLASIDLPLTPFEAAPDPTGEFSPLLPFGVNFDGIARSVDFGGTIDRIGFDNITLGSQTPTPGPIPPDPDPTPTQPDPDPTPTQPSPIPTPPDPDPTPTPTDPTPTPMPPDPDPTPTQPNPDPAPTPTQPNPNPTPTPPNPDPTPTQPNPTPVPTPMPPTTPTPMPPVEPPAKSIPETSSTATLLLGLAGIGSAILKRHARAASFKDRP